MTIQACEGCGRPAGSLNLQSGFWICRHCYVKPPVTDTCRPFERGRENPMDKDGSTAHIRDIKRRRWDPVERRSFNYAGPKTYFH